MSDIVVTTPKGMMVRAAREAEACIEAGGGRYFRRLGGEKGYGRPSPVPRLEVGDRIFYVEDGFIRGFAEVCEIRTSATFVLCDTAGEYFPPGTYAWMEASSWKWIRPIPMRGFQGWMYSTLTEEQMEPVGGWLDPRPALMGAREGL